MKEMNKITLSMVIWPLFIPTHKAESE
jgi:hypothetical protein